MDRQPRRLVETVSAATGIDADLFVYGRLHAYSVEQRMSWAARREITRVEYEAYCLIGIFKLNTPLLLGFPLGEWPLFGCRRNTNKGIQITLPVA